MHQVKSEVETSPTGASDEFNDGTKPTRVQSGVNLPNLQTRQRADTGATKESSNDDELRNGLSGSPLRLSDEKGFHANAISWQNEKSNNRVHNHLFQMTWLEKIESLGS